LGATGKRRLGSEEGEFGGKREEDEKGAEVEEAKLERAKAVAEKRVESGRQTDKEKGQPGGEREGEKEGQAAEDKDREFE
jgi:hypothetical protein